ncbi:putative lipoprotein NlpC [Mesocricetibacter intestinalis]|uniref:Putative lipoprotein NlpC n=1 Tax=Mesocricetibacter intestinalis TaxID=1521930 RepID=A0A4R6VEV8_9PAST|nr:NlpC/P60 family protein [Mesocricetibacter intestinalis]TDQ59030.1 putative lipoprotein NlpC [Mesocricetibacter intestinalis]
MPMSCKKLRTAFLCAVVTLVLAACSSGKRSGINYQGQLGDPIMVIALLSEQQYEWAGTPYVLGGQSRRGVDCSGFVQTTFMHRFNVALPRMTKDQAKAGVYIEKEDIQTGDLVFFKTGAGPNGYHVGIYVKEDKFLHASTKGGVIYSSLQSPYWRKTYWQARRI